jgi:hypothetical protein
MDEMVCILHLHEAHTDCDHRVPVKCDRRRPTCSPRILIDFSFPGTRQEHPSMLVALIFAVTAIAAQIGLLSCGSMLLSRSPQRLQKSARLLYVVCLLWMVLVVLTPILLSIPFGIFSFSSARNLCGVALLVVVLALLGIGGNIGEAGAIASILIWMFMILIPMIEAARIRHMRQHEKSSAVGIVRSLRIDR